jgi:protein-tyrosine phosphatase
MAEGRAIAVLFCCTGNICRSPTAEGVFRHKVAVAGLKDRIRIDSAGTHDYHTGDPPDDRSQAAASMHGYELGQRRARQITLEDLAQFDYILAMDRDNLAELRRLAAPEYRAKPRLLMDYSRGRSGIAVPDPYSGGPSGFELVVDMVEDAADGLLDEIKKKLGI